MARPTTTPPIAAAQNTAHSTRFMKAARATYTRAKRRAAVRIIGLGVFTVILVAAAVLQEDDQIPIGLAGVGLLVADLALRSWASESTRLAVAMQERFDNSVFQLESNDLVCSRTPTPAEVAQADAAYKGESVEDWYPDTSTLERPLDVLVCQQSNAAWGRSAHRKWATFLLFATVLVYGVAGAGSWLADVGLETFVLTVVLPTVGALGEVVAQASDHFATASEKAELEQQIGREWSTGLQQDLPVDRCRRIQDRIVSIRMKSAQVPDWFHRRTRDDHESTMRATAAQLMAEAQRHGRA